MCICSFYYGHKCFVSMKFFLTAIVSHFQIKEKENQTEKQENTQALLRPNSTLHTKSAVWPYWKKWLSILKNSVCGTLIYECCWWTLFSHNAMQKGNGGAQTENKAIKYSILRKTFTSCFWSLTAWDVQHIVSFPAIIKSYSLFTICTVTNKTVNHGDSYVAQTVELVQGGFGTRSEHSEVLNSTWVSCLNLLKFNILENPSYLLSGRVRRECRHHHYLSLA